LRAPSASCIFRRTSSLEAASYDSRITEGELPGGGRGVGRDEGRPGTRGIRARDFGASAHRHRKRKSLPPTENKTNKVKNHIARAQAAPHPNADGQTAIERFATPR
jgi:hypothetical protein